MLFKSIRALLAASMLLLAVGCGDAFSFTPKPTPTPSPTATSMPTHTPAPTPTITPSPVPRKLILGCVPSPDGRWLAVVDDLGVRVYDTTSYSEMWRVPIDDIPDGTQGGAQLAWASDSTALTVSVTVETHHPALPYASYLCRLDGASGRLLWQQSLEDRVLLTFSADGNHFLLKSEQSAELWGGSVPERTGALELPQYADLTPPRAANWSPDGKFIAGKLDMGSPTQAVEIIEGVISLIGSNPTEEPSIFVWDAVTGKLVTKLRDSRQRPNLDILGWSPDGSYLISDENGRFILWDRETWSYRSQIVYDAPFNMASIELSPDGTKLVSLLYYNAFDADTQLAISAWDIPTGKQLPAAGGALLSAPSSTPFDFVGWMPDGNSFLFEVDGRIITLDVSQGQVGEPFPIPEWLDMWWPRQNYYLDYYQLSPDGKHIYFVEPQAVVVYNAQTGEVIAELAD